MLVTLLPIFGSVVAAHMGCGGAEIGRRNLGGPLIQARQSAPTDEPSGAISTDPAFECTYYTYAPVVALEPKYPVPWVKTGADILPGDTEAMTLFATINATVNAKLPNDLPRGTPSGNFTGSGYTYLDPDCWWTWGKCTHPNNDTGIPPDITTVPEPLTWGLGFDDGPNCSHNALYDMLKTEDQKATMFYIGSSVMNWPLQALRGIDEGHQIAVHTWSHQYMTAFSNQQAFAELYYTRSLIKDLLGVTPKYWRPPYGDVDNRIRMIAMGLNLTTIVWSDDTEDWKEGVPADNVTAQDVANNYQGVINNAANGTYKDHGPVVLNHELTNFTMSAFIQEYPKIKQAFQHIVPICTAINDTHPYVETNFTCPTFSEYISGVHNTSTSTADNGGSAPSGSSSASASATASASKSGAASERVHLIGLSSGWLGLILGFVLAGVITTLA